MERLLIHVEGETEETFVKEILRRHLAAHGWHSVAPRVMGNARQRDRRGGIRSWPSAKRDILLHLKQDRGCVVTTMVDYYGLPQGNPNGWPGRSAAAQAPFQEKARLVESALLDDIAAELGAEFDSARFVPFVVMHEFEGLLFSDCAAFARGLGRPKIERSLQEIRNEFKSPEEINDSPFSAPSKRLKSIMPEYEKPLFGNLAAIEIGLARIRQACPHFASWLAQLEALGTPR